MPHLHLFEAFGIELEYMIVDRDTLKVKPIADKLFTDALGHPGIELEHGEIGWSNELALHVLEMKTSQPWKDLKALPGLFNREIRLINQLLQKHQAELLSTGAHPTMDPLTEACLWPHEQNEIYESYNRIFDCRGHGWVNLQSTHLNLPFANDQEFEKLHAAIRLVLPLLPALAASTPFLDGKVSEYLDARLSFYGSNQRKVPLISGSIIPEDVASEADYQAKILSPIYRAIAPHDPQGILQYEWLNSRAAIARFDRMAIEIRILDIQETPLMDLSIIALIVMLLQALVAEKWCGLKTQRAWHESALLKLYQQVIKNGRKVQIQDADYLSLFGIEASSMPVNDVWSHILKTLCPQDHWARPQIELILTKGSLAERMLTRYHQSKNADKIAEIYRELGQCLGEGKIYGL